MVSQDLFSSRKYIPLIQVCCDIVNWVIFIIRFVVVFLGHDWVYKIGNITLRDRMSNFAGCGVDFSQLVDQEGSVWGLGTNWWGELGLPNHGYGKTALVPTKLESVKDVASVHCTNNATLFLDVDGFVFGCGFNSHSELGLAEAVTQTSPLKNDRLPPISAISTGSQFSLFLDTSGQVWSAGNNDYMQLGHRGKQLGLVENLPQIKSVSGGSSHSLFLDHNGCVWACGNNTSFQLGRDERKIFPEPRKVENLPEVTCIIAAGSTSLFIDVDNNIWGCGYNDCAQLLHSKEEYCSLKILEGTPENIKSISRKPAGTFFLDHSGSVYVVGTNFNFQLGIGANNAEYTLPQKIEGLPPISYISDSRLTDHTFFIDTAGDCWGVGKNSNGKLGFGDVKEVPVPTKIQQENFPRLKTARKVSTKSARNV